jgi:hypothetical protein
MGALLLAASLVPSSAALAAVDLLPDIITVERELRDAKPSWGVENGCVHMTFSNGTANVGQGPAEIYGAETNPDGSQDVYQRVYRDDGSFWDRLAGTFVFHPTHRHIHFEGWALYSLREMLPGGGVGPVLYQGDKTSFCLLDSQRYDRTLPGYPSEHVYIECDNYQGISVGWEDFYGSHLPGQSLRMCGIAGGTYWLESEVDPDNQLLELDDGNNVARIPVVIPPAPECNDGIDNDGDGFTDHPADPGCAALQRQNEAPACNDGVNNDADAFIDYPADRGCSSAFDLTESNTACGIGFELALALPALAALRARTRRARR